MRNQRSAQSLCMASIGLVHLEHRHTDTQTHMGRTAGRGTVWPQRVTIQRSAARTEVIWVLGVIHVTQQTCAACTYRMDIPILPADG